MGVAQNVYVSLVFCLVLSSASAQSVSGFLATAMNDEKYKGRSGQMDYLSHRTYRLPWLQRFELRTQSNQLDAQRQEYGIRLHPANPWEVRNNNAFFKEYLTGLALERQNALEKALLARYRSVAELIYYHEMTLLKEQEKQLLTSFSKVHEGQQGTDAFQAEGYLESQLDQMDVTVEGYELQMESQERLNEARTLAQGLELKTVAWTYSDILSVSKIKVIVDSLLDQVKGAEALEYARHKVNLAQREFNMEKSNVNVGFVQASYEPYRINQNRTPVSLSMGITLPLFNPNKGDMALKKMEMMEAQSSFTIAQQQWGEDKAQWADQVTGRGDLMNALEGQMQALNTGSLANTLLDIKEGNPLALLRFERNMLRLKVVYIKQRRELVLAYLSFLDQMDVLQQWPLLNYFSEGLDPL